MQKYTVLFTLCYYQLHDEKLADIIESFKSFYDSKNLQMLEFILPLTTNDDQKITLIYQKIVNDDSFVNQIEICERLLFDYYTQEKQFEKANAHAIELIQLLA